MKKAVIGISNRLMGMVSVVALFLAVASAGSACYCWSYQPDVPDALKKYDE